MTVVGLRVQGAISFEGRTQSALLSIYLAVSQCRNDDVWLILRNRCAWHGRLDRAPAFRYYASMQTLPLEFKGNRPLHQKKRFPVLLRTIIFLLGSVFALPAAALFAEDAKIYFIGHTVPDTDSIASAIGAAHFFNGVPARTGQINRETQFLLDKSHLPSPLFLQDFKDSKVVLLDFNQKTQAPDGLSSDNIQEIFDHHALGDASFTFANPIYITIKPWGSTSTIIADLYFQDLKSIPQDIAVILLGGIISDTLNFCSPTTTNKDREIAQKLKAIAAISNTDDLAKEMFEAKSAIEDLSGEQLLKTDYKEYVIKGHKIAIGVIETTAPQKAIAKKDSVLAAMSLQKEKDKLDIIYFDIVDISHNSSTLITLGGKETELAEIAFNAKANNHLLLLPAIVSRKGQLLPMITKALR